MLTLSSDGVSLVVEYLKTKNCIYRHKQIKHFKCEDNELTQDSKQKSCRGLVSMEYPSY